MPISKLIQPLLTAVLSEVETDPEHKMSPQRRREIYDALGNSTGQQALRWLAVITAQAARMIYYVAALRHIKP